MTMSDDEDDKIWKHRIMKAMMAVCIGMMILCALVIAHIFFPKEAHGQTLSSPLPPGCTAPTISGTTVSCAGGPTPPVCAPTPPMCPATVPAGCAPCTPPPPVSCGDLHVTDMTIAFNGAPIKYGLGKGDKEVLVLAYTAIAADSGKKTHINAAEYGSSPHYYTWWVSKTKCLMDSTTMKGSNQSPSVYVSVNGTESVNMVPGEVWYFMLRNWKDRDHANSCNEGSTCGTIVTPYLWQNALRARSRK
jgi:hypothetical protein